MKLTSSTHPRIPHLFNETLPFLDFFAIYSLSEGEELLQTLSSAPRPWNTSGAYGQHWWLISNNTPVAYCKTITHPGEEESLFLSDIEVRLGFKRRGLARKLTSAVSETKGEILYSTGNWTEEGALGLLFLPIATDFEPGIFYKAQTFVKNWEKLTPKYP